MVGPTDPGTGQVTGDGAGQGTAQAAGRPRPGQRRVAQWMRDYARLPGIPDEYLGEEGPRPVWTRFFDAFSTLSAPEIERRFGAADRHLREGGVTYRAPGEAAERAGAVRPLPRPVGEMQW